MHLLHTNKLKENRTQKVHSDELLTSVCNYA